MGSDKKKHKKESKKRKHRSRSGSIASNSSQELKINKERHERKKHKKHKGKKSRHRSQSIEEINHSDSSDCVEVPLAPPPAPTITKSTGRDVEWEPSPSPEPMQEPRSKYRSRSRSPPPMKRKQRTPTPPNITQKRRKSRSKSFSPISDSGAGDCLSIEATNRLRAKLGLKPLEVGPEKAKSPEKSKVDVKNPDASPEFKVFKDDWGEFMHKPAVNLAEKSQAEKIREKLKERKDKRMLEAKITAIKGLGEFDEEDDTKNWVKRQREQERLKQEAAKRAKLLEEMDEEFGVGELVEQETRKVKKKAYTGRDLKGLKVEHDFSNFMEGKQIVLTLKDKGVLDEEEIDTLVNVNMVDDERYKKSNENKKQNPNRYGYDVYEEQVDEFGQPIERNLLAKYDDEIGHGKKSSFVIGENVEQERQRKRNMLELKAKLNKKKLETLDTIPLTLASEYYNDDEMTKFKKPKKKLKKVRQRLKADDLLAIAGDHDTKRDFGSRQRLREIDTDDVPEFKEDLSKIKVEADDDLEHVLAKARRLKQKEAIIKKSLPFEPIDTIKKEIEREDNVDQKFGSSNIILNETAEFCRTLGDIPTYGLAGNRDTDNNDMMDFDDVDQDIEENARKQNTWNTIDPDLEHQDSNDVIEIVSEAQEAAILDEEPDVAAGVAAALQLAMSKGYLEKEDKSRPSNTRFAHLQAQHYSIEDKAHGEDDKYGRRDRYSGPLSDFREKEGYKPNVKLEYIDDNGHLLNAKEAFRYLSHKFHGKGPGKNKVEKRLKKAEQETLMMKMSSTDTPLGTLNMLQEKQKETQSPFVVLSGNKAGSSFVKQK